MFETKKSQNLLAVGLILFLATSVHGVRYLTNVAKENAVQIVVDCDSFNPFVINIAESDVNKYCDEKELSQRFDFITYDPHTYGTGLLPPDEVWNDLRTKGYDLLIGEFTYFGLKDPKLMLESNNLFLVNPDYYTSRAEFTSDRYYGILADDPENELLVETMLAQGRDVMVIVSTESLYRQEKAEQAIQLFELKGGEVYGHITLPYNSAMYYDVEDNYDFTEYLLEANAVISAAIAEHGEEKVGVLIHASYVPVLIYQSRDMNSIQNVPWFTRHYELVESGTEWADPYAAKVKLYHTLEVIVNTERLIHGQNTNRHCQKKCKMMSLPTN